MFQGLSQGGTVYLLYRNIPKVADARIVSVNTHLPSYNPQQPLAMMNGPVTDITIQIGDETIPFAGLPANGVVANFPEKGYFLSTDKSAIIREVEAMSSASKQILQSIPAHEQMVRDCEALLLDLNPDKKKEAEQAKEITALRGEIEELKTLLRESMEHQKKEK